MFLPKDYWKMLEPFLEMGFTLRPHRRHIAVLDPEGRVVSHLPSTPGDGRSLLNSRAVLRRAAARFAQRGDGYK